MRTSPVANERFQVPDVIGLGGAIAGLCGGLAAMLVGAVISLMVGGDVWLQAKQIAAIVYGPASVAEPGFVAGPVIVGTIIHLITSMVLGAIFGILEQRVLKLPTDLGIPVLAGLIYGMLTWMIAFFIVLPLVNPLLLTTYTPSFIIQHVVYGIVTGVVFSMIRPAPYVPEPTVLNRPA